MIWFGMFKKALVLVFVVLLALSVFSIRLADPISKDLADNDFVGSFVSGSTIELVFSKELGKFDSLKLGNALPQNFNASIKYELESVKLLIELPKNAVPDSYPLLITMSGPNNNESVEVYFTIDNSLVDVSLNNYFADTTVNGSAVYAFSFVNNSYSDVQFTITPDSSLGWYWFSVDGSYPSSITKTFLVPKRKTIDGSFTVYPRMGGDKKFSVNVSLANTNKSKSFDLRLNASPTLLSKSTQVFYGLPFYSFSLLPNFFLNGLVASFFK